MLENRETPLQNRWTCGKMTESTPPIKNQTRIKKNAKLIPRPMENVETWIEPHKQLGFCILGSLWFNHCLFFSAASGDPSINHLVLRYFDSKDAIRNNSAEKNITDRCPLNQVWELWLVVPWQCTKFVYTCTLSKGHYVSLHIVWGCWKSCICGLSSYGYFRHCELHTCQLSLIANIHVFS